MDNKYQILTKVIFAYLRFIYKRFGSICAHVCVCVCVNMCMHGNHEYISWNHISLWRDQLSTSYVLLTIVLRYFMQIKSNWFRAHAELY